MLHPNLPPELWRRVFFYACFVLDAFHTRAPEYFSYPPTLSHAESRQLLLNSFKTRLNLVFVCRDWSSLAEEFLYEAISFRSKADWDLLCRILKQPGYRTTSKRGWWTRRVDFTCWDDPTPTLAADLAEIFETCLNLEVLTFMNLSDQWHDAFADVSLDRVPASTVLRMVGKREIDQSSSLFSVRTLRADVWETSVTVIPLSQRFQNIQGSEVSTLTCNPTLCPNLTSTTCSLTSPPGIASLTALSMPALRHLVLDNSVARRDASDDVKRFIGLHAKSITSLRLPFQMHHLGTCLVEMTQLQDLFLGISPFDSGIAMSFLRQFVPRSVARVALEVESWPMVAADECLLALRAIYESLPNVRLVRVIVDEEGAAQLRRNGGWMEEFVKLQQRGVSVRVEGNRLVQVGGILHYDTFWCTTRRVWHERTELCGFCGRVYVGTSRSS